jgi:hypothetical protein
MPLVMSVILFEHNFNTQKTNRMVEVDGRSYSLC